MLLTAFAASVQFPVKASGRSSAFIGAFAILVCIAAYWPGLTGDFVLDDQENFAPLYAWLDGRIGFEGVLAINESGPLGRPLSMLSFALTAAMHGMDPFAFKLTNLAVHLICATLIFILIWRLATWDSALRDHRLAIAAMVAVLWMLAPIQVSTVLYPVQRMAQLSGALVLLGLIVYATGRPMLDDARQRNRGLLLIYVAMPLCTVTAMMAKESGAVLPLLCAALEFTVFRSLRRPRHLQLAYLTGALAPAAILLMPSVFDRLVLQGYDSRDFTLAERLLTQPRVLWDYVGAIVMPNGPRMGLIHDDFVVSRGWLTPPATLIAILAWTMALFAALILARSAPMVCAGVLLFLGAHAVESTVFPLEIYFEHRNYVASAGVWIAIIAGFTMLLSRRQKTPAFRTALSVLPALFIIVFASATHARAAAWASWDVLLAQAVLEQRDSARLNAMYGASLLERGDLAGAISYFERVPRTRVNAPVVPTWIILATCMAGETVDERLISDWAAVRPTTIAASGWQALRTLTTEIENQRCRGLDAARALQILYVWTEHLDANEPRSRHWRMRYYAARLAAASGQWPAALSLARDAASDSDDNLDALVLWFQISSSTQDRNNARAALDRLQATVPDWHFQLKEAMLRFEASLAEAETSNADGTSDRPAGEPLPPGNAP